MKFSYCVFTILLVCKIYAGPDLNISKGLTKNEIIIFDQYSKDRNNTFIDDSISIKTEHLIKPSIKVLHNLHRARFWLYGPTKRDDLVSKYLTAAKSLSDQLDNNSIRSECLYQILMIQKYFQLEIFDSKKLKIQREKISTTDEEKLENQYFYLLTEYERIKQQGITWQSDSTRIRKHLSKWNFLLNKLGSLNSLELKSIIEAEFAINLEKFELYDRSLEMYNASLETALQFSEELYRKKYFVNRANVIGMHIANNDYENSIRLHREIGFAELENQAPDDLKYYYKWVAEAFKEVGEVDSAVYYYDLVYKMDEKSNALKEVQKAADIKSEYEKQKHESELSKWRKRLLVTASLFFLLIGATYGNHRYQSLKKKAVEAELQKAKIQATLDVTKAKMQGEQEERKVIASVLHDQVASLLTAVDMHLAAAKKKSGTNETNAIDKADEIIKDVNEQVRNLSHKLVSPTLMKFGLGPAIDSLCSKLDGDEMRIAFQNRIEGLRIDSSKEIFLYRSCSELLNNAMKYSKGNKALVELFSAGDNISLKVSDNGVEGVVSEESFGLGLAHISNYAQALEGKFEYGRDKVGFSAIISLPID